MKKLLVVLFLSYAIFGGGLLDWLDAPKPEPQPEPKPMILDIEDPSEEVLEEVYIFRDMISDPSDKAKLAIFNYDFSQRLLAYDATTQELNDVYVLAGKNFFKDTLLNKYEELPDSLTALFTECVGDENHTLTAKEKEKLHKHFKGLAWVLIQKG